MDYLKLTPNWMLLAMTCLSFSLGLIASNLINVDNQAHAQAKIMCFDAYNSLVSQTGRFCYVNPQNCGGSMTVFPFPNITNYTIKQQVL